MYRQGRFRTFKKPRECLCDHPAMAHYRDANGAHTLHCRIRPCACKKFSEKPRISKYHAVKQEFGGHHYDSKFEARVAADLDLRLRSGDIAQVERQIDFPFIVNGKRLGRFVYRADFVVTHLDGSKEIVEAKGLRLPIFNLKWELMQACYPELKFTLKTQ
jgi:hypothetical protein